MRIAPVHILGLAITLALAACGGTNVPTVPGAHQVAYDETNRIVYTTDRSPNGGLVSFALPSK